MQIHIEGPRDRTIVVSDEDDEDGADRDDVDVSLADTPPPSFAVPSAFVTALFGVVRVRPSAFVTALFGVSME